MSKTPTEIINEELPEHILVRFWENWKNDEDSKIKSFDDYHNLALSMTNRSYKSTLKWLLEDSFYYGETNEGYAYWRAVYRGERDEETLNKLIEK